LILGGWTQVGYWVALSLAEQGVKLKVALQSLHSTKKEELEKLGATIMEYKRNAMNSDYLFSSCVELTQRCREVH